VATVQVTPARDTAARAGDTVRFRAAALDAAGARVSGATFSWSSQDPAVATVDQTGIATVAAPGTTVIKAESEGASGEGILDVIDPVASVVITPARPSLDEGDTLTLSAVTADAAGHPLTGRPVAWSSSDAQVASVSSSGLVTALAPGQTTVSARSEATAGYAEVSVAAGPPSHPSATLVGAGDIATCIGDGDEATAQLLDGIDGTIFTAGDNVYEDATAQEFAGCYGPTWGRHKGRTRPTLGNHEYKISPDPYFDYFEGTGADSGVAGKRGLGYYSYDVGAWHVLALNSNLSGHPGSPQAAWVAADLAAHPARCTLAIWHHPLFASDSGSTRMRDIWQLLYAAGADVVVSGHEHNYERWPPLTAAGVPDNGKGIREFVVGTGGRSLGGVPPAGAEVFWAGGYGVLKLTLRDASFDWQFISEAGQSFADGGSASCH
jgi:hypothetical protein